MRIIPTKLREEMARDPYYKRCCITGRADEKIEWHHNLIFAGHQINEKWCILPLSKTIHDKIKGDKELKDRVDQVMLNRATDEELSKYSKLIDLIRKRDYLNKKYGKPKTRKNLA